ncbi:MAG: MoaD/ThiS family protein [Planctomycetaceae bacterium]|nr:MoaD/ThiS family protein [Planctomycetaceae bacterium]
MKLRVQYMAQLRTAVGRAEEEVEMLAGSRLAELLHQLANTHGAARSHFVTEAGQARPSLLIVVNDSAVPAREAATTVLHADDVVTLLPPIAGG